LSSAFLGLFCFVFILFGQACVSKCTKLFFSNRVIHKVEKERVPLLGFGKRDNKHKKAQQAQKGTTSIS
jgi:hypothetical protein